MGYASLAANTASCPWEFIFTLPAATLSSGTTTSLVGGSTLTLSGSGFINGDFNKN